MILFFTAVSPVCCSFTMLQFKPDIVLVHSALDLVLRFYRCPFEWWVCMDGNVRFNDFTLSLYASTEIRIRSYSSLIKSKSLYYISIGKTSIFWVDVFIQRLFYSQFLNLSFDILYVDINMIVLVQECINTIITKRAIIFIDYLQSFIYSSKEDRYNTGKL